MFKERPTFPRYTVTYDAKNGLDYVKKCFSTSETSLATMAAMMRLLSGQRSQTSVSFSIGCMCLINSGCVFYISKLLKASPPKSHQQPIEFQDCVHYIFASLFCISKIKHLRNKEKSSSFHFESSLRSRENQILTFQIFKFHDSIKCISMKHETQIIE